MHPDKTGRRELGVFAGESCAEFTLVVIVAECVVVVNSTNINDDGACREGFGVAGTDERGGSIFWEESQEEDGQSFVGVEVAIVSSNDGVGGGGGHLLALDGWGGGHEAVMCWMSISQRTRSTSCRDSSLDNQ